MNAEEPKSDEQPFLDLLAACDDALAVGATPPTSADAPGELRERLERDVAGCGFVRASLAESPTLPAVPSNAVEPPRRIGRFVVGHELGRGSFGIVYHAIDPVLGREVALKIPRAETVALPELRDRFRHEARAAAGLDHPNLVSVYEAGEDGGVCYIASAYCRGVTLASWLRAQLSPVPVREAAELIVALADGVEHAHRRGILHRDLKPANVLLDEGHADKHPGTSIAGEVMMSSSGRGLIPKIADFGLAKLLDAGAAGTLPTQQTRDGAILGTPDYMAPEQADGAGAAFTPAVDVYALGAILYELLTGRPPFRTESPIDTILLVRTVEPLPPGRLRPNLPRDLETICLTCLQKQPARRYASAWALTDDLRRFLSGEPIKARRTGAVGRFVRWCRRNPGLVATISVAVLTTALVTALSFFQVVQERDRYRVEREQAVTNLYQSLNGEARAIRLARVPGYRTEAWSRLEQALRLDTPSRDVSALRQEAAASLGDFVGLEPAAWRVCPPHVYAVAFAIHPDGQEAALGLTDGSVSLRDVASGRELAHLNGHSGGVFAVTFGADGGHLATGDDRGGVKVWIRQPSGEWACTRTILIPPSGRPGYVHALSLSFSPDGNVLYHCARTANGVSAVDLSQNKPPTVFRGPRGERFYRSALSRDGQHLAAALDPRSGDGILVWDVASGKLIHRMTPGLGVINDVVFSADGKRLACACEGGVAVYDAPDYRSRFFVRGDVPNAVAFSPDGQLLAIPALEFGLVRLWNVMANRETAVLKHEGEPHSIAFTPDGRKLIALGASLTHVWDLRGTGEKLVLAGHDEGVCTVGFSPDGNLLVSAGADRVVRLSDPHTGRLRGTITGFRGSVAAALSPDGHTLCSIEDSGEVKLWDVNDPTRPVSLGQLEHDLGAPLWSMAFSPDGRHLAIAGDEGVALWTFAERGESHSFRPGKRIVRGHSNWPAFTSDGRTLVWTGKTENFVGLHLWDLETETISHARSDPSSALALFPDSRRLVVVTEAKDLEVLDLRTGDRLQSLGRLEFRGQSHFYMGRLPILTRDGRLLAVDGPSVSLWDLEKGALLFTLPQEQSVPRCLAWSPDHTLLAIGSSDGGVVIWNMPAIRKQLGSLGLDW